MTGYELVAEYQTIWDEFSPSEINQGTETSSDHLLDRGFVFQFDEGIRNIDVLFIGINPSYQHGSNSEKLFYTREQGLNHAYFKPFDRISTELFERYNKEIVWSHLDLLVFKETSQSYIKDSLLKSEVGVGFIWQQLQVAKKVLEYLNPKVIVVSNTQAREFLGTNKFVKNGKEYGFWMNYDFEFDEEVGTKKVINNEQFKPYAFFTSMLSGQRALDLGSRERLVWHINRVLG